MVIISKAERIRTYFCAKLGGLEAGHTARDEHTAEQGMVCPPWARKYVSCSDSHLRSKKQNDKHCGHSRGLGEGWPNRWHIFRCPIDAEDCLPAERGSGQSPGSRCQFPSCTYRHHAVSRRWAPP